MNQFKIYLFTSVISANNDELTEDEKQLIIQRYTVQNSVQRENKDWTYIFEPIKNEEIKNKFIAAMESEMIDEIKSEEDKLPNDIEPVEMEVLRNEDSI